jgi:hypothetical protein
VNKLDRLILGLSIGSFMVAILAQLFSLFCGRYNEQCGGSVQGWQWVLLILFFFWPILCSMLTPRR